VDIEVPKLVGMGVTTAKTQIEDLGLKAVVRWVAMAETPTNVVLNQEPAAGHKLKRATQYRSPCALREWSFDRTLGRGPIVEWPA